MALASQTFILGTPTFASPNACSLVVTTGIAFAFFSSRNSRPKTHYHFSPKPNFYKPNNLIFRENLSKPYMLACSSKKNPFPSPLTESTRHALIVSPCPVPENPTRQDLTESTRQTLTESTRYVLTESTRTVSTLVATVILVSKLFGHAIANYVQGVCKLPSPSQLLTIQGFRENMISTTRPLFFAAVKIHRLPQLHTPWTIMASGLARCIEVYMALLGIRTTLSFFPNVEWNTQPYSGLRDLCDPFLLLFQNIVPPLFNVDMSPTLAFTVLSVLVEILTPRAL